MWALVTSVDPLRVYMHVGGLVLFSGDKYDQACISKEDGSVGAVSATMLL